MRFFNIRSVAKYFKKSKMGHPLGTLKNFLKKETFLSHKDEKGGEVLPLDHERLNYATCGLKRESCRPEKSTPTFPVIKAPTKNGPDYRVPPFNCFRHCATFFELLSPKGPPSILLKFSLAISGVKRYIRTFDVISELHCVLERRQRFENRSFS